MVDEIRSNFTPKNRLISDVSNEVLAVITTTVDHGYTAGLFVTIFVPEEYGMDIYYEKVEILDIPADNQIIINYDTSALAPYVTPTSPPGFTEAQVILVSGLFVNNTSITG